MCIDYVYSVPTIVRAGVTLASTQRQVFAGGKGLNQSIACAKAGATTYHAGAVGRDGSALIDALQEANVDVDQVLTSEEPSGHAFIQVDPTGKNGIVICGGANRTISSNHVQSCIDALLPNDWLLLQNEINDVEQVIRLAAAGNAQIALNLAPADERIHNYPIELLQLLIVNEDEGVALANARTTIPMPSTTDVFTYLAATYPGVSLVLTQGEQGLLWHAAHAHEYGVMSSHVVTAIDETAAGDAFVGYLMASLTAGESMTDALRIGSAAGALATTKAGAAPSIPSLSAVEALSVLEPGQASAALTWEMIAL